MYLLTDLIRRFQKKELQREVYYRDFLKEEDANQLWDLVNDLVSKLETNLAILAVGSSVFPKYHWEGMQKLNKKFPDIKAPETYRDIDLLLIPKDEYSLVEFEEKVKQSLTELSLPFKADNDTTEGVSYCPALAISKDGKEKSIICPYVNYDYGKHSIKTNLPNHTQLDLILGRDDLVNLTAEQKIAQERKNRNSFSILYRN